MLTTFATVANAVDTVVNKRLQGLFYLLGFVDRHLCDVQFASNDGFGNLLRGLASFEDGVAHEEADALTKNTFTLELVNNHIGQGHLVLVNAINAEETADGTFDSHGGVAFHKILHLTGNFLCHTTCMLNFFKIETYFTFSHISHYIINNFFILKQLRQHHLVSKLANPIYFRTCKDNDYFANNHFL